MQRQGANSGRPSPYVAVVGSSDATTEQISAAEQIGRGLAQGGAVLVCGGGGGVMAAACRGADSAGGLTIGLLPGDDRRAANEWVGVALATGLGELRNGLIVRVSDAVIAVGGEYGTLSEVALALKASVPVVGLFSWEIRGVLAVQTPRAAVARALELANGRGRA
jgi:uncharacterized protein (TIGR00725 family)